MRAKYGENQLPTQKPTPWWRHLWVCYRNPFNILLTILGVISYATEDLFAAGVIALMVGISTLLNFVQEARSTKAADALKAMVSNTATVLRVINEKGENSWVELPIDQLVPGDIIKLAVGRYDPGGFTRYSGARSVCRAGFAHGRISAGRKSGDNPRPLSKAIRWNATRCALWAPTW